MSTVQYTIRVRQGDREVEVAGTEEFVREMIPELIATHLDPPDFVVSSVEGPVSAAALSIGNGPVAAIPQVAPSFRDMLNTAARATAAEKVLLAGYFIMSQGNETFDAGSASELFDSAYETKPNFSREFEKAAKRGYMIKVRGGDGRRLLFRLTHRGIGRVRELMNLQEAT
jgi:hypothetical protein